MNPRHKNAQNSEQKPKRNSVIDILKENAKSPDAKTKIHVRFCVGFNAHEEPDLNHHMEQIKEVQKAYPGTDFEICIYPNNRNEDKVKVWLQQNKSQIEQLGDHFYLLDDWRLKNAHKIEKAKQDLETYWETDQGKKANAKGKFDSLIKSDIQRFKEAYNLSTDQEIKEASEYVSGEAIDCLSLLERKNDKDDKTPPSCHDILVYTGKLNDTIGYLIGSEASNVGRQRSLLHVQKYGTPSPLPKKIQTPEINLTNDINLSTNDINLSMSVYFNFLREMTTQLVKTGTPPEYVGTFIKNAFPFDQKITHNIPPNISYGRLFTQPAQQYYEQSLPDLTVNPVEKVKVGAGR